MGKILDKPKRFRILSVSEDQRTSGTLSGLLQKQAKQRQTTEYLTRFSFIARLFTDWELTTKVGGEKYRS